MAKKTLDLVGGCGRSVADVAQGGGKEARSAYGSSLPRTHSSILGTIVPHDDRHPNTRGSWALEHAKNWRTTRLALARAVRTTATKGLDGARSSSGLARYMGKMGWGRTSTSKRIM